MKGEQSGREFKKELSETISMEDKLSGVHTSPAREFRRFFSSKNKNFKELFRELYNEFPRIRYKENKIKEALPAETDISALVKHGFLIAEPHDIGTFYGLGPNGLLLINAWEIEKLTRRMLYLTIAILAMTAFSLFFRFPLDP